MTVNLATLFEGAARVGMAALVLLVAVRPRRSRSAHFAGSCSRTAMW